MNESSSSPQQTSESSNGSKAKLIVVLIALVGVVIGGTAIVALNNGGSDNDVDQGGDSTTQVVDIPKPSLDHVSEDVERVIADAIDEVNDNNDDGKAWGMLGMAYYAHGFTPAALTCFKQAEALDSKEFRWPYLYGMVTAETELADGLPGIERAVELEPDNLDLHNRLAEFLFALQRMEESRSEYETVIQAEPTNARALLGLARIAYQEEDWEACRERAQRALQNSDSRPDIHELLSQAYFRLGDPSKAQMHAKAFEELKGAGNMWPDDVLFEVAMLRADAAWLMEQANQLGMAGQTREQYMMLERILDVDPTNMIAYAQLCRFWLHVEDFDAATRVVERGLKHDANATELRLLQGVIYNRSEKYAEAEAEFKSVVEIKPDYAEAYYLLSFALTQQDKKDEAIQALRDVLRYEPLFADAHRDLGTLLTEQGNSDEGKHHLDRARELSAPGN